MSFFIRDLGNLRFGICRGGGEGGWSLGECPGTNPLCMTICDLVCLLPFLFHYVILNKLLTFSQCQLLWEKHPGKRGESPRFVKSSSDTTESVKLLFGPDSWKQPLSPPPQSSANISFSVFY